MVLNLHEYVNNNLIGDVVEPIVEILYSSLVMLLEDFELWVSLVQLE